MVWMRFNGSVDLVLLPGSSQALRLTPDRLRRFFKACDDSLSLHGRVKARRIGREFGVSHQTVYTYLRKRKEIETVLSEIERLRA